MNFYRNEYGQLVIQLENVSENASLPENAPAKDDLSDLPVRIGLKEFDKKRCLEFAVKQGDKQMTESSGNKLNWSRSAGEIIADAMIDAGLIKKEDFEKAAAVAAAELLARLSVGDYPPPLDS